MVGEYLNILDVKRILTSKGYPHINIPKGTQYEYVAEGMTRGLKEGECPKDYDWWTRAIPYEKAQVITTCGDLRVTGVTQWRITAAWVEEEWIRVFPTPLVGFYSHFCLEDLPMPNESKESYRKKDNESSKLDDIFGGLTAIIPELVSSKIKRLEKLHEDLHREEQERRSALRNLYKQSMNHFRHDAE